MSRYTDLDTSRMDVCNLTGLHSCRKLPFTSPCCAVGLHLQQYGFLDSLSSHYSIKCVTSQDA